MTRADQRAEIGRIEATLRSALEELATRLAAGERNDDMNELTKHCREMSDLLLEATGRLDDVLPDVESIRAAANSLVARVIMLERDMARTRMH